MGQPKALLAARSGRPLALEQAALLHVAGLSDVIVVLGHGADEIAPRLDVPDVRVAFNPAWATGRISSLQTGIKSAGDVQGVLVVPVDTVGVNVVTLATVLEYADTHEALAVRPCHRNQPGRILWISHALFEEVLGIESSTEFRFDAWIADRETTLAVEDQSVLHNVNTREEWDAGGW